MNDNKPELSKKDHRTTATIWKQGVGAAIIGYIASKNESSRSTGHPSLFQIYIVLLTR